MKESISDRLEKRDLSKVKHCSICDAPRYVEYKEKDEETGKVSTRSHIVECGGHDKILPYLWNLHPLYDEFQKWEVRHRVACSKPKKGE